MTFTEAPGEGCGEGNACRQTLQGNVQNGALARPAKALVGRDESVRLRD